jgi:Ca-activated chloride channel family protein
MPKVASLLLLCFLAAAITPAPAQLSDNVHISPRPSVAPGTQPPGSLDPSLKVEVKPLRVDVDLVLLPVTVTDAMNRVVMGLTKETFQVYEDGKQQDIRYFFTEESPISIGIILDLSGSMANKLGAGREALSEFFRFADPRDDYFVITFAERPRIISNTTQSLEDIQAKLATVEGAGNTALLDAIALGVHKLRSARYQRRALLIISDGGDNSSHYSLGQIKHMTEETDISIYAIGVFENGFPWVYGELGDLFGKHLLNQVTNATGGRMLAIDNASQVAEAAATISRELRSRYVLGYRRAKATHDGRWKKLKVRLIPPAKGMRLRAFYKEKFQAPANDAATVADRR